MAALIGSEKALPTTVASNSAASTLYTEVYSLIIESLTSPKVTMRVIDAINPFRFAQMDAETRLPTIASVGNGCLNL